MITDLTTCKLIYMVSRTVLNGVYFDPRSGPVQSGRQLVDVRKWSNRLIRFTSEAVTEDFYTENENDARYVHHGWPAPSTVANRPWDVSMPEVQSNNNKGAWATRRTVFQKWRISLSREDISLIEPFANALEDSLTKSSFTARQQLRYLREVFAAWFVLTTQLSMRH
jgi:hypothetical protein